MTLTRTQFIYHAAERVLYWRCQPLHQPGVSLVALIAQLDGRRGAFILTPN